MRTGVLYIMVNENFPEYIKVGMSSNMKARMAGYNDGNPKNVITIVYESEMFINVEKAEKMLLKKLGAPKTRLEWYDVTQLREARNTIAYLEGLEEDNLI